ncbi:unnamed protein product [Amaranthus hypochondriacus]
MFDLNEIPIEEVDFNEEEFDESELQLDFTQIEVCENQIQEHANSVGLTSEGSTSCILNEGKFSFQSGNSVGLDVLTVIVESDSKLLISFQLKKN